MSDFTGDRIRKSRELLKMDRQELIEEMKITKSALAKWENNDHYPKPEHLRQLSEKLKVSTDYLLLITNYDYNPADDEFKRLIRSFCLMSSQERKHLCNFAEKILSVTRKE